MRADIGQVDLIAEHRIDLGSARDLMLVFVSLTAASAGISDAQKREIVDGIRLQKY